MYDFAIYSAQGLEAASGMEVGGERLVVVGGEERYGWDKRCQVL